MDGGPEQPAYLYELGSADPEMGQLAAISRLYGPMTGAWLDAAGIRPGMRVADLGCGPGDVTLAAAERVGPSGAVVGGDSAPPPPDVGRRRGREAGLRNVSFERGDVPRWRPPEPVDAVVG